MNAFRRRRTRRWMSLLAIAALLWSQTLLALHAACVAPAPDVVTIAAVHGDCDDGGSPTIVCQSHCSQGEASPDTARIASVPALGTMPIMPAVTALRLQPASDVAVVFIDPGRHRPTRNPASVLLI